MVAVDTISWVTNKCRSCVNYECPQIYTDITAVAGYEFWEQLAFNQVTDNVNTDITTEMN